jgi:hypothetical protein
VRWVWASNQLSRRVLAAQERPEQTALLLANVTNLAWLIHLPEQEGKPAQWQPIATAAVLAQPTQSVSIARGIGLRLTVAGRPIEKVFLMGR